MITAPIKRADQAGQPEAEDEIADVALRREQRVEHQNADDVRK